MAYDAALSTSQIYKFSIVEGFVEISESTGGTIKHITNEPSVGLYYIQEHAQKAIPNVVLIKNNVDECTRDSDLQTEDLDDSSAALRSMKECGFSIAQAMIEDIKGSLAATSTKQSEGPGSWNLAAWSQENGTAYFSNMF